MLKAADALPVPAGTTDQAGPTELRPRAEPLSNVLREYRELAGLTQQQLAERSYVSIRTIRNLENGKISTPRGSTLASLADALELAQAERLRLGALAATTVLPAGLLPAVMTPLIGRDREMAAVSKLLDQRQRRLITLTGMAGVGKTRLAQSVAVGLIGAHPVWWIPLKSRGGSLNLLDCICEAIDGLSSNLASLITRLGRRGGLLVLDDVEALDGNGAEFLSSLLASVPDLMVLATSPRPLGIVGEQTWPVRPLPVPPSDPRDPMLIRSSASVELLVDRLRGSSQTFELNRTDMETAAEICRQLDGLPIALEFAAVEWRRTGPHGVLEVLAEEVLDLSGQRCGQAGSPMSLREVLAADLARLEDPDQTALACLSVFRSSTTVNRAVSVIAAPDALNTLERLVANGLVIAQEIGGERRLSVPRTIAALVADDARMSRTRSEACARHAAQFANLAALYECSLGQPDPSGETLRRRRADSDDILAALVWYANRAPAFGLVGGRTGKNLAPTRSSRRGA